VGTHEGNKDVKIWTSANRNGKWTFPVELQMEILVREELFRFGILYYFRSSENKIFLFYKAGPNPRDWWGMYKTSSDQGKTWSEAIRLARRNSWTDKKQTDSA
jgi:predicted neuraminidase